MALDGGQLAAADPALAWFGPPLPAEVGSIIAELARVRRYDTGDELLREMANRARNALAPVPDSIYKQEMLDLIDLVLDRDN